MDSEAPFSRSAGGAGIDPQPGILAGTMVRTLDGVLPVEYLTPGEVDSVDQIKPGEGAIVRRGLAKLAVHRAEDGTITERSAACTHVGCIVHWNGFEKCWDCPCHGSQFLPDGSVLNGPAVRPLAKVEGSVEGERSAMEDSLS